MNRKVLKALADLISRGIPATSLAALFELEIVDIEYPESTPI